MSAFFGPDGARKRRAIDEWVESEGSGAPEVILFEGLDDAILGLVAVKGRTPIVVYDREQVIAHFIADAEPNDGLAADEARQQAEEYVDFNVTDAYCGEGTPGFLTRPWDEGYAEAGLGVSVPE